MVGISHLYFKAQLFQYLRGDFLYIWKNNFSQHVGNLYRKEMEKGS
jgi:hypothetical protein